MKITKSRLKQIIKEEIIESGGSAHSSGPPTTVPDPPADRSQLRHEDTPDSDIQSAAAEFFTNLVITDKVVAVLINNIATPDLITIMEKIPKIDTAAQEDLFA
tara:strand:+ start:609 stop:917 length:309 start_codon:yes stop_codon:yes gene_type:complete